MLTNNSQPQEGKKLDPLYDLIMNEDLQKNEWPKVLD